jgi:phosphoserine phosphatase RsbX
MGDRLMRAKPQPLLEYGIAARGLDGAAVCGDLGTVYEQHDAVLVAVADGFGSGSDAVLAARTALAALASWRERSLERLVADCHAALRPTRGAVLALATLDAREATMCWLGVGNIEGRLLRPNGSLLREAAGLDARPGIAGMHLPALRAATVRLARGDIVVFATDGIAAGFEGKLRADLSPQSAADHVLKCCAMASDDALVLVGRWLP